MINSEFEKERIVHYYKEDNSGKDESYVREVFCDDNKEKELRKLLSSQFNELKPDDQDQLRDLDHILYKIHYDINTRISQDKSGKIGVVAKWTLRIASIVLLPLVLYMGIKNYRETTIKKETWVEIKAPAWTRAQFGLPDGTTGWLNSNSTIRYNGNFIAERKVYLNGEAFFDVIQLENRTFSVCTPEIMVKVLGTRFNIASYDNEKAVEVVLEDGKLQMMNNEMDKSIIMNPDDLVIYDKTIRNFSTEMVHTQKYTSWTEGKLVFRNDPLDVIARRLERWYNVDIELNVSTAEEIRWRATFVDDSLEEVLMMMKRSLKVDYKIENRNIKPDETYSRRKVILIPQPI